MREERAGLAVVGGILSFFICYRLHDNTKSFGIKELDGRNVRLFGTGALIILQEKRGIWCLRKCRITLVMEDQPMLWVQKMNGIRTAVEEIVFTEIIYG